MIVCFSCVRPRRDAQKSRHQHTIEISIVEIREHHTSAQTHTLTCWELERTAQRTASAQWIRFIFALALSFYSLYPMCMQASQTKPNTIHCTNWDAHMLLPAAVVVLFTSTEHRSNAAAADAMKLDVVLSADDDGGGAVAAVELEKITTTCTLGGNICGHRVRLYKGCYRIELYYFMFIHITFI